MLILWLSSDIDPMSKTMLRFEDRSTYCDDRVSTVSMIYVTIVGRPTADDLGLRILTESVLNLLLVYEILFFFQSIDQT